MVPWRHGAADPTRRAADRKESTIDSRLIVENLSDTTTESDLVALFSGVGRVSDVHFPTDHATGAPKGFAYLVFADEAGAGRAIERLNGCQLEGAAISVRRADSQRGHGRGDGGNGLWGGGHAGSRPKGSRRGVRGRKRAL